MPKLDVSDMRHLAYPNDLRQQYAANIWQSQRQYFLIMLAFGAFLFLLGGVL